MNNKIQKKDLICGLPDELVLKILSSLPSKDVVTTSVLSKRWQSLWKEMKTFRYDEERPYDITISKFTLFISTRPKVEILQLKLNPCYLVSDIKHLMVNNAVARSLKELRIEMVYNSFELPESLFSYPQLETLSLEKLSLVDISPNASYLPCLKRLKLLSVRLSCDESVKNLLSICPRLEELVVRRSTYTNVKIFSIINVPMLRSLCIDNSSGTCRPKGVHGFVINAPSLRCFSIRDRFSNYLRFGNMPELVKSTVNVVCDIMT